MMKIGNSLSQTLTITMAIWILIFDLIFEIFVIICNNLLIFYIRSETH